MSYPKGLYPTIVEGFVKGEKLRFESLDGSNMVCQARDLPSGGWFIRDGGFYFENFGPLNMAGKTWGLTHLQKYSTCGWLRVNPDCYHRWWFWKPQQQDANGNWVPGSERGIYFRRPFSWRWDVAGTTLEGELRHWIWTKGYLGGHWD